MKSGHVLVASVSALVLIAGATPALAEAGDLDPSFGRGGITSVDLGTSVDAARSVAIQPDGKILVAANGWSGKVVVFAVIRLLADGALDPSFGSDGIAQMDVGGFGDNTTALALQNDGRIVVAGEAFDEDRTLGGAHIAGLLCDHRRRPMSLFLCLFWLLGSSAAVLTGHTPLDFLPPLQ